MTGRVPPGGTGSRQDSLTVSPRSVASNRLGAQSYSDVICPQGRPHQGVNRCTTPLGEGPLSDSFVHLHVHTEYSMLDGAARVDDLFREAARMEMPALAMTDHGYLFGAVDFYQAGKKH